MPEGAQNCASSVGDPGILCDGEPTMGNALCYGQHCSQVRAYHRHRHPKFRSKARSVGCHPNCHPSAFKTPAAVAPSSQLPLTSIQKLVRANPELLTSAMKRHQEGHYDKIYDENRKQRHLIIDQLGKNLDQLGTIQFQLTKLNEQCESDTAHTQSIQSLDFDVMREGQSHCNTNEEEHPTRGFNTPSVAIRLWEVVLTQPLLVLQSRHGLARCDPMQLIKRMARCRLC
jgi:hypothetical protein